MLGCLFNAMFVTCASWSVQIVTFLLWPHWRLPKKVGQRCGTTPKIFVFFRQHWSILHKHGNIKIMANGRQNISKYLGPRRLPRMMIKIMTEKVEWPWRLRCQEVPVAPSAPRAPESRVHERLSLRIANLSFLFFWFLLIPYSIAITECHGWSFWVEKESCTLPSHSPATSCSPVPHATWSGTSSHPREARRVPLRCGKSRHSTKFDAVPDEHLRCQDRHFCWDMFLRRYNCDYVIV